MKTALALLCALAFLLGGCRDHDRGPAAGRRVLLIGDSIMDQEGGAAELVLQQHGVHVRTVGMWGSSLFTRDQYDLGRPVLHAPAQPADFHWLSEARKLVDTDRPALVVVALNHNFPSPHPRDAQGHDIDDLRSPAGRSMIATQARTLLSIVRRHGADVAFATPPPEGAERAPADNPIWAGYLPVLREEHVSIIDIAPAVAGPGGERIETASDCRGTQQRIRKPNEVHYTRLGAARAGTVLAVAVASRLGVSLHGDAAPGEHTVALVPTSSGRGYWLVQCDGSVFHFGDAPAVDGVAVHDDPVVAAVPGAPRGLWLVTRSGVIRATGVAAARQLTTEPPEPIVVAGLVRAGNGVIASTGDGTVFTTDGSVPPDTGVRASNVIGITAGSPRGYVLADTNGSLTGIDGASAPPTRGLPWPAAAFAGTPTGLGGWFGASDGRLAATGDAVDAGNAVPPPVPPDIAQVLPDEHPPVVAITARAAGGYWILRDNGGVVGRGGAPELGATANLALFTQ